MPRSTREWARRKLKQASDAMDWAGKHITDVATTYEVPHPETGSQLYAVAEGLSQVKTVLEQVANTI